MTWRALRLKLDAMDENYLDKEVPIFHFANGDMELLNNVMQTGVDKKIDSHCKDIKDFDNQFYLLCGL